MTKKCGMWFIQHNIDFEEEIGEALSSIKALLLFKPGEAWSIGVNKLYNHVVLSTFGCLLHSVVETNWLLGKRAYFSRSWLKFELKCCECPFHKVVTNQTFKFSIRIRAVLNSMTRHIRSKRLSDVTHLSYDVLMDNGVKLDCPGGQALDADSYHAIGTGG